MTAEVTGTLARMVGREPDSLPPSTRLVQDLDFDSTSVLELLMAVEAELGIEFDPDTFGPGSFETVESVVAYVRRHLKV
ncbi:acyl carrier protein [Streptomyces prasinopilosus]|uniref:Acyl carrier protein n=1 Tax=Streptomyces prasinopilosus TaxID=67344 RepID=A0A1G6M3N5_9ACTN|nr:acyl carrier protein [Streptomyces prasinopilosus]